MSSSSLTPKPAVVTDVTPLMRGVLLTVCYLAQTIDSYNGAAFFVAIPPISFQLGIDSDTSVWLISAYQLTFASFLLGSGRVADLFGPSMLSSICVQAKIIC
jgi:MFS family permease